VENDPYCQRVLKKHWPEVTLYDDIKEIDWSEVERPDLICGGFPCPVVSQAARGRNNSEWLWPAFRRCLSDLQPDYALVENVVGLRHKGRGLLEVVGDLTSLGYGVLWATIPASAFGAPHRRARIWVVAYPYGHGQPDLRFDAKAPELPQSDFYRWLWTLTPERLRVANGVPGGLDFTRDRTRRLRALGNAVVPQVAEWIGQRILATEPAS
jgi:DNA (cytosine-5)-methyltransferase 1